MKRKPALTLAALFFTAAALGGCKDEAPRQKTTPSGTIDIYDTSHIDRQYLMTIDDLAIRTATGRELKVTTQAYCQTEAGRHKTADAYKEACRAIIAKKLMFGAGHEDGMSRFESYLPMGSQEIRPYNYFDEAMMLRALPVNYKHDLYTVTDVRTCSNDERTPLMDPRPAPPEGGWPNAEARKKSQSHQPAHGRVVDNLCRFQP